MWKIQKTIYKIFYGFSKVPKNITKRSEAEKAFYKAMKTGIKAGNHYYNATKRNVSDKYVTKQFIKAELKEKKCLALIDKITKFLEKNQKFKTKKSKLLNDLLDQLSKNINELGSKINELKTAKNIKS